ncbi:MAG TPA: AprI/Inh family metalloprotease inhibitor [Devosia sp.]|nr:AprI/Inh family metalloprotease inhibitor [Devosia sp.]
MKEVKRGARLAATLLLTAALVSGCSTFGDDPGIAANDQPGQLPPVTDSTVSSDPLPPIGGAPGADAGNVASTGLPPAAGAAGPGYDDQMNQPPAQPGAGAAPQIASAGAPGAPGVQGTAPGGAAGGQGFVSLHDVNQPPAAGARDLSGGLTVEKLLGGWTVTSGDSQCRLNFTYTAVGNNDHYRASSPGCVIATLAQVASWRLSGTQVQLFDGSDRLVGALLLSGDRFIGTLTGGQAITMAG